MPPTAPPKGKKRQQQLLLAGGALALLLLLYLRSRASSNSSGSVASQAAQQAAAQQQAADQAAGFAPTSTFADNGAQAAALGDAVTTGLSGIQQALSDLQAQQQQQQQAASTTGQTAPIAGSTTNISSTTTNITGPGAGAGTIGTIVTGQPAATKPPTRFVPPIKRNPTGVNVGPPTWVSPTIHDTPLKPKTLHPAAPKKKKK